MKKYTEPVINITSLAPAENVCRGDEVEISVGNIVWDTFDDQQIFHKRGRAHKGNLMGSVAYKNVLIFIM